MRSRSPSGSPVSRLILVGAVHGDPLGYARTQLCLHALQPDLLFVELSPYGKAFRSDNQAALQRTLHSNLSVAAGKHAMPLRRALGHPEIKAIRRQLALPFEYRAAFRYSRASGAGLFLVDDSSFSRRIIASWPEMLSAENLSLLLSLSRESRFAMTSLYDLAARRIRSEGPAVFDLAEAGTAEADPLWKLRERRMADAVRSVLWSRHCRKAVYLGGWRHLATGGNLPSLRELLGIGPSQCHLLDRGLLCSSATTEPL